jgi:RNA polymerase sigma-70 factor (ECF subfamily)
MSDRLERLCEQAQAGNGEAAAELVSLFYERVFAYFRRLSGNDQDAADLTQRTFLKVWVSLGSYAGRSSLATWIHGIAHHVYVDWRRRPGNTEARPDDWWETCAAAGPGPFETVAERDLAFRLYRAVEQLDPDRQEAVHLHYYQGLSLAETAEALGVAVGTVKYRLRDALDQLRARTAEPPAPEKL